MDLGWVESRENTPSEGIDIVEELNEKQKGREGAKERRTGRVDGERET